MAKPFSATGQSHADSTHSKIGAANFSSLLLDIHDKFLESLFRGRAVEVIKPGRKPEAMWGENACVFQKPCAYFPVINRATNEAKVAAWWAQVERLNLGE